MHIIILYDTTEGQTRKIARYAQRHLSAAGHATERLPAAKAQDAALVSSDAALLVASVHGGSYRSEIIEAARYHRANLSRLRTAFVSVSLPAAGEDPDDWRGLRDAVDVFQTSTGWEPGEVLHVAGAFWFLRYDWLKTWAMRRIAAQRVPTAQRGNDVESINWAALDHFLDRFAGEPA